MPHRYIKRQHTHITTGYIIYIGVEESEYEAIVLDAGLHHPRLTISVKKLHGLRLRRKRIQYNGKHTVYLDQVESHHELATYLEQLFDFVHAVRVGGAVYVRVLVYDARVVHKAAVNELVAVTNATQVVQRG